MTKRLFSFLLGLVGQTGCVIYDDALRRQASDAALDAPHDGVTIAYDVTTEAPRFDVVGVDAQAIRESGIDVVGDAGAPPGDASDANSVGASDARDATIDPTMDAMVPPEVGPDAKPDTADAADESDGGPSTKDGAPSDSAGDPPIVGCTVDFTVSGVVWDDDAPNDALADGGARIVRLVGDIGQFGAWAPISGLTMMEKAPGAWSTSITLPDHLTTEFKFVKIEARSVPEWEQWPPFDSNRSFSVDCFADGGTVWVDASLDGSPASRAVGHSYGGAFGVKPLDATK